MSLKLNVIYEYCMNRNEILDKMSSSFLSFRATYFHLKEKGRVICALQYLHAFDPESYKSITQNIFWCLCLNVQNNAHFFFVYFWCRVLRHRTRFYFLFLLSLFICITLFFFIPLCHFLGWQTKFVFTMLQFN